MNTKRTIITIGGSSTFNNEKLAFKEIDRILKEKKITKKDLLVYGYEDSFDLIGAYKVAEAWALKNKVPFYSGQVKKGNFTEKKKERDETLSDASSLLINLRTGSKNGGKGFIDAFVAKKVPVEVVDESPREDTSKLTPVQRRKAEIPSEEKVKEAVSIYSKVAQRLLEHRCLMLDTETTGMGENDEVIELAIGDSYSGTIIFEGLIKPSVPVNPEASKIHGITDDLLKDAPSIEEIWDKVNALVGNRIVLASHGVSGVKCFDQRLLNQSLAKHGMSCSFLFMDLQPLYRLYSYQHSEVNYPLRTDGMALQLGIEAGGHRASGDVKSQIGILKAMAEGIMPNFEV